MTENEKAKGMETLGKAQNDEKVNVDRFKAEEILDQDIDDEALDDVSGGMYDSKDE